MLGAPLSEVMTEYRPGACNIGRDQRRRRLYAGGASLAAAVVSTAWVLATDGGDQLLAVSGLLLFGAVVGYLQYRLEFCVGFAALARYDLGEDAGTVQERTALYEDRMRAVQIVVLSLAIAGLLTAGIFLLDLLVVDPPGA